MSRIADLEPRDVFAHFEKICTIPRGSGNTDEISDYLVKYAADKGFEASKDAANNVVIRVPATPGYEDSDVIILQGHHDMVCEKVEGKEFDFEKEGIEPFVDGEMLRADGTTLGGDNGIAVAMMLAILDDKECPHPELEMLITADEEDGMIGAHAFDCSTLKGHKMINLDSEFEDILICSCAGGVFARNELLVDRCEVSGDIIGITIKNLKGGHSGIEIDKGRANANILMARMLGVLNREFGIQIISLEGGTRDTGIANIANASVYVREGMLKDAVQLASETGKVFCKEYSTTEPDMLVEIKTEKAEKGKALTLESTKTAIDLLNSMPDGVQEMSADMKGLVQTSTNLGTLKLDDNKLTFCNTIRSAMTTQKNWILLKVASAVELAGGICRAEDDYPGWAYNPYSEVKDAVLKAYKILYDVDAKVDAVHAGAECGLFADAIPNIDCVSIGPSMWEVHTPNEHLKISSVGKTYNVLKEALKLSK